MLLDIRDEKDSLRHRLKTLEGVAMPYAGLPANTTVLLQKEERGQLHGTGDCEAHER